ncbi:MAG: 3-oxoacyl-[acyl-carrier-protein] synthase III C-terminal domain-containing protein [Myxococcota bacterium]
MNAPTALTHHSRFESLGLRLPERRRTMAELLDSCRHRHRVDLERLTGIREHRVCAEDEDSYSLAVDAAWDCLSHSRYGPEDVEMLISCSITTYQGRDTLRVEPSMSFLVKEAIGATHALHFDVRNACAGMVTGLYILDDFIRRGVIRRGMVVSGEYVTSIADNAARKVRTILSKQLASLTVGDSGSAVLLERAPQDTPGIEAFELATYSDHSDLCIGGPCETGPGGAMFTDARKLHAVAIESAHPTLLAALEKGGISPHEVHFLIPHQTSVRAIRAGIRNISPHVGGLPPDLTIVYNLEKFANTASTTHFVALYRYLEERRFEAGDRILLLIFASGVVCGSLIFTMDELREKYGSDH